MKFDLLPFWKHLILAGSLFGILAAPSLPVSGDAVSSIPTSVTAQGKAAPVGTRVDIAWHSVPDAQDYKVYRDGQFLVKTNHSSVTDYAIVGGATHGYAVSSLGAWGESALCSVVTAQVPDGGGQVVYDDSFQNTWQSWGWAKLNCFYGGQGLGKRSISVTAGPWQAMYLHHAPFATAPFTALTFWIHGGTTGGQSLSVYALRNNVQQTQFRLSALSAGAWQQVTIPLSALGVANVPDMSGIWIQNNTGTAEPTFYVDSICLTSAPAETLAAPADLAVNPQWSAHCPTCGTAMPHMILTWNAVPSAVGYLVSRNGAPVQTSLTTTGWTDMSVTSGQTYTYTVAAKGQAGQSPQSPPVSAVAPNSPAGVLGVPTNLEVVGSWLGTPFDTLTWTPSLGAVSYNIYQYDVFIGTSTNPTFTVPASVFNGAYTYTVTAVNSLGMESLPSCQAGAVGGYDPTNLPGWVSNQPPGPPTTLVATPEFNLGQPRISLTWRGSVSQTYNVYRDGTLVAKGVWVLYYIDSNLQPGETHTYTVTGINGYYPGGLESMQSASVAARALTASPTRLTTPVTITKVIPNDDSCMVFFNEVPGAADYRIYDIHNPGQVKYAGVRAFDPNYDHGAGYTPNAYAIEWNGIDPAQGADLIVEAVDKVGPFQKMDGSMGSGGMAGMSQSINGQGDPSDVPNVLAASSTFHVNCQPRGPGLDMTGSQVFFDNFRNEQPLRALPCPPRDTRSSFYGDPNNYREDSNDKWIVKQFGTDLTNTSIFFMNNHMMDTTYDGGGPGSSCAPHNSNATTVFQPKATADISGGKVLHVTWEVDAKSDGRRWCNLYLSPVGAKLLNPAKFDSGDGGSNMATDSGWFLRWLIREGQNLTYYPGDATATTVGTKIDLMQDTIPWDASILRIRSDGAMTTNGTAQDLDKRHRFDLYLSATHYRFIETTPDGTYSETREKDFPAGLTLPSMQIQVYFVHEVYHTDNERNEAIGGDPYNPTWYNFRPYADERHWDNMGFEVLSAFPSPTGN